MSSEPVHPEQHSEPSHHRPTISELVALRLNRREATLLLAGLLSSGCAGTRGGISDEGTSPPPVDFEEISAEITLGQAVASGHRADVLISWGDPVLPGAPAFDPRNLTADAQSQLFGTNNDFIAYFPLPRGSENSDHGLLCVNHESLPRELFWPSGKDLAHPSPADVATELAAHGQSIFEIRRVQGRYEVVRNSAMARRITGQTPIRISGPAAGTERLRTSEDPSGRVVIGTLYDCSGGVTPWGTVLLAEENINEYFSGVTTDPIEARTHQRYEIGPVVFPWAEAVPRFDLSREPREANRFGWIVEVDPYDPTKAPVKRTALGRFRHEGATVVLARDGRVVVYSGDDQKNESLYKFVSRHPFDANASQSAGDLLDEGTLYVARFDARGGVRWLPLEFGVSPLLPSNGFHSQADVLIETRRAADLVGATPMDRPEGVVVHPKTQKVYVALTNNIARTTDRIDAANPRENNHAGHILEILPKEADHAALEARFEVFLLAGNPGDATHRAVTHPLTTERGWVACPDNFACDQRGRLWIATDQGERQAVNGIADGLRVTETEGPRRALPRLFYKAPIGAEVCGPCFTPDNKALFIAIQHPGEGTHPATGKAATFDHPLTRWPDTDPASSMPPRSAIVVITRDDGGVVG